MVASLHQFRCFLAAARSGSFTAAAAELGMAQQSVSEQVRLLERACGVALFIRVGRGLRPTEAAHALTPHAERAIAAGEQAVAAARAVRDLLTGTVRLGVFGTMRYYVGAELVASILTRYPELSVEIVGQNSAATIELVRAGDVEAGIVALPVDDAQLSVRPVFRDEVLYVSADPARASAPATAERLAKARLVLPYASWAEADTTRRQVAARVQAAGSTLRPVADVDDVETALEIAARGLADTIADRGILRGMGARVPPHLVTTPLRPRMWDSFAVVHRRHTDLSPATRAVLELAVEQLRTAVAEPA
jgi:DNA-binding transcriptional LysR family regulator